MSDIPFEIQSEIMKRLPVKSLIQFRYVCKQWMLDDNVESYTSIDDNTFPQQKFPLTAPESLSLLRNIITLSSVEGLLCFCGDIDSKTEMAVIWNPTVRKSVGIVIPRPKSGWYIVVGFGVCADTSDPKLVKITVDYISSMWVVEVFTLSTRVWKSVYMGVPFKSCTFSRHHVFVDGVIYFRAYDDVSSDDGVVSNIVISFDLKSEKFGEVRLPERLLDVSLLDLAKVNDSLGLLEYFNEGEESVCGVWTRNNGANKPFTKIYTVRVEGKELYGRVLGFRNNGEVVIELDDDYEGSSIEVYEPSSGHINGVGVNGERRGYFYAKSYMETLLLLDESDSII